MKTRVDRIKANGIDGVQGWVGVIEDEHGQTVTESRVYWEDTDGDGAFDYATADLDELVDDIRSRR